MQAKEIYRSNSLPINATLQLPQKDEGFIVPKYQAKSNNNRLRSRSNSLIMKQPQPGTLFQQGILHTAASEPVLNTTASTSSALLAQLLTTNSERS
jgi:MAX-like protein X